MAAPRLLGGTGHERRLACTRRAEHRQWVAVPSCYIVSDALQDGRPASEELCTLHAKGMVILYFPLLRIHHIQLFDLRYDDAGESREDVLAQLIKVVGINTA